jgi:glycosyltransferase involved in cell wall biosynthesis
MGQVRFHGRYSNQDIGRKLRQIDVVVVPSMWYENSPLTIQEAFLAGVPVITANRGGMKEWVDKGGGLLFDTNDAESLAAVLKSIIDDPSQLESLRQTIPQVPSAADVYPVWEQLYQELSAC